MGTGAVLLESRPPLLSPESNYIPTDALQRNTQVVSVNVIIMHSMTDATVCMLSACTYSKLRPAKCRLIHTCSHM